MPLNNISKGFGIKKIALSFQTEIICFLIVGRLFAGRQGTHMSDIYWCL
jgi:hypothetical protein